MNSIKKVFNFKFDFTKETRIAFIIGVSVVGLSFLLTTFQPTTTLTKVSSFLILDIFIKLVLGFFIPLWYILINRKYTIDFFGITKKKWKLSLLLGIVFMILLLFQFLSESKEKGIEILIKKEAIIPIVYILVSGIFEMTFIYGFLRKIFDKSFGIIPGIILTAIFYSFHHAGFQPEFSKLIFVGIMYAGIYRITNNLLIVFPFFWGIGAIWDVLVNFGTDELQGLTMLIRALFTLLSMIIIALIIWNKTKTMHNILYK